MKALVTGAAGFIGSHLAEALQGAGHEVVGVDCFTDYYDPALKEENARGLDVRRLDLAEDALDLGGVDGVFHLAAPAGRAQLRRRLPALRAPQPARDAARASRPPCAAGVRVVFASSSSVYGDAEALSDAGGRPSRARSRRTGSRSSRCEQLARAYASSFGLDAVVLRYFTVYGPRQRPDMFFRRVVRGARRRAARFELYGDGRAVAQLHRTSPTPSRRRSPRWSGAERGALYNVGGGDEATMLEAIALLERISGRTLDVAARRTRAGRRRADEGRRRRGSARELGWEPRTCLEDGLARSGRGPRLESPPDEPTPSFDPEAEQEVDFGRYWRLLAARWWLPLAGLVARRRDRLRALARRQPESTRRRPLIYLGQPYSPSGSVAPVNGFADEPERRRPDRALRVVRPAGRAARAGMKPGALRGSVSTQSVAGRSSRRPARRRSSRSPCRRRSRQASRGAANALARGRRSTRRLGLRRPEDQRPSGRAERRTSELHDDRTPGSTRSRTRSTSAALSLRSSGSCSSASSDSPSSRRQQLDAAAVDAQQQLALAQAGREARASSRAPRAVKRPRERTATSLVVGALIGLILGALAAIALGSASPAAHARPRASNYASCSRARRVAVVVPAHDEEELIATTLARDPGVRRPDLSSSTTPRRDATARARARRRRPARRGDRATSATAASAPRSSPATSARSPSGIDVTVRDGRRQPDGSRRSRDARRCRSRAARSTTRRRTGSSPARRGS